jgi:hypothetical protein
VPEEGGVLVGWTGRARMGNKKKMGGSELLLLARRGRLRAVSLSIPVAVNSATEA